VLRQALLEESRQLLLDRVGAGALCAAVQMGAHCALRFELQAPLLIVQEMPPHLIAGHAPSTACAVSLILRSP
jgi:hypothetical protein